MWLVNFKVNLIAALGKSLASLLVQKRKKKRLLVNGLCVVCIEGFMRDSEYPKAIDF